MFASHGEFPRIVLTSGDHEEAFYDTIEAFNMAEKYQVPVIHLLDKYIANSMVTMKLPDIENIHIDRGKLVEPDNGYKRFSLATPISPRSFIGSNTLMWHSGSEHDEIGHNTEDPIFRTKMYEKRMKKLEIIDKEVPMSLRARYYGPSKPDYILVGWGFVKHLCLKAIDILKKEGENLGYLHIKMFTPFPSRYVSEKLNMVDRGNIISVEHNYMAQSAMAISTYTGIKIDKSIAKYSGRPIYLNELVPAIKRIVQDETNREVLTYGA
jgi:2-oxoglutarate ferredoxin oxidoreductase subunit alpha